MSRLLFGAGYGIRLFRFLIIACLATSQMYLSCFLDVHGLWI